MCGQTMNYKISLNTPAKPIMPSELPNVTIDYKGLLSFAKQKGVRVIELTEHEKNLFVKPSE
ncbi:MAG: hypothetical protein IJD96_06550 [Lachnospiraceae bacterium]|nr:hypothetical protein [Lachnospiraceae bacterium]